MKDDKITPVSQPVVRYRSVFSDLENTKRADDEAMYQRFERMLSDTQTGTDYEGIISHTFVKALRQPDGSPLFVWQAVWYENDSKSFFGTFYHSVFPKENVVSIGFVRELFLKQKDVGLVDITFYTDKGLPFHYETSTHRKYINE